MDRMSVLESWNRDMRFVCNTVGGVICKVDERGMPGFVELHPPGESNAGSWVYVVIPSDMLVKASETAPELASSARSIGDAAAYLKGPSEAELATLEARRLKLEGKAPAEKVPV